MVPVAAFSSWMDAKAATVRQLAGVGEEQQPGRIEIETSDCNPAAGGKAREHGGASAGIVPGNHLANRLVIEEDPGF